MTRFSCLVMVVTLLMGLAGCAANPGIPENTQVSTTENESAQYTQANNESIVYTTGSAEEYPADLVEAPTEAVKVTDSFTEIQEVAHVHNYDISTTMPTCTENGYTIYSCSCGDSYIGNGAAALGHSYITKEVAPTRDTRGYTLHSCTSCGSSYKDNWTDPLPDETLLVHEHDYSSELVSATCLVRGYTLHTCACGDTFMDNYTEKEPHTMVTAEIVYQTYESDGYYRLECSYGCGESETMILPRLTEYLDTTALAAYGRQYAEEAYGYTGNTNCTAGNGAGFYSPLRKKFTTMEEGKRAVRECVDSHHRLYTSYGNDSSGVPINVYMSPTEDPTVFLIFVYYGGEC